LFGRDHAFEVSVLDGMILGANGKTFIVWVQARPFWDGPTQEHAIQFQPEVVMQAPCRMFLYDEHQMLVTTRPRAPLRLRGLIKIPLLSVVVECHGVPDWRTIASCEPHGRMVVIEEGDLAILLCVLGERKRRSLDSLLSGRRRSSRATRRPDPSVAKKGVEQAHGSQVLTSVAKVGIARIRKDATNLRVVAWRRYRRPCGCSGP
jgi:hypothetical protein